MIPKIVHYCWFGKGQMPKLAITCIKSWEKYLPEYKFIKWDENNFDINSIPYVKEAYENKKYAFVSDYVRLYAMYHFGGIYMDTDVEVLSSLDRFLANKAFSGFESEGIIPTGIMASEKNFKLFEVFLEYYADRHFIKEDGSFDMTTNTVIMTNILKQKGFIPNGQFQVIEGFALYPKDFFCPLEMGSKILMLTDNSVTIHYFSASWYTPKMKIKSKLARILRVAIGIDKFNKLMSKLKIKSNT